MKHFTLPATKAPPALAFVPPMTPDRYLVLRRTAAGLSKADAAALLAERHRQEISDAYCLAPGDPFDRVKLAGLLIDQLETPGSRARERRTIEALQAIFPLDPDVYHQLVNEPPERHPFVCHACGCSNHDPCTGTRGVCSVASSSACTRCIGRDAGTAAAA